MRHGRGLATRRPAPACRGRTTSRWRMRPSARRCAMILQSPDFDATPRSRRFLSYIVDEALAGRADRIKAFTIATDVFGRSSDFDAHADPIVRLEAGRLRRALEQHYDGAGHDNPIVISVPKGAYVPVFEARARPRIRPRRQRASPGIRSRPSSSWPSPRRSSRPAGSRWRPSARPSRSPRPCRASSSGRSRT